MHLATYLLLSSLMYLVVHWCCAGGLPWSPNLQRQSTITERMLSESLMSKSDRPNDSHSSNSPRQSGRSPSPLSEQGSGRNLLKVAPEKGSLELPECASSRVLPFADAATEDVSEEHTESCSGSDSSCNAASSAAQTAKLAAAKAAPAAAAVQNQGSRQEANMHLEPAEDFDEV